MSILRIWPDRQPESHEDAFVERYERLRGWSLHLSEHDPSDAEDLLQTAFVQFCLRRPDLAQIENLDGYLYTLLRNLRLSQVRRVARQGGPPLSIVDYDSIEVGLHSVDPRSMVYAMDDLRAICRYACARKESSKAGGVLLLRFFHGYYPSEIGLILRSPARVVNGWLQLARREARLAVTSPAALRFVPPPDRPASSEAPEAEATGSGQYFLDELRDTISRSRRGPCLSQGELREYQQSNAATLTCARLAHVASCRRCLDAVSQVLGLSGTSERDPMDMLGPNSHSQGGPTSGPGPRPPVPPAPLRRWRRRLQDVLETSPSELRIAVNGFAAGTLKVRSATSELALTVNGPEPVGFVEVFTEQSLQLAHLVVLPPPAGEVTQSAVFELSAGRLLQLSVCFSGPWPTVTAVYTDPLFSQDVVPDLEPGAEGREARPASFHPVERKKRGARPLTGWLDSLRATWQGLRVGPRIAWSLTAAAAVLLLLFVTPPMWEARVSAAEILNKTTATEKARVHVPGQVFHRVVVLTERQVGDGRVVSRRRVETWQHGSLGVKMRRVFDASNRVIAAERVVNPTTRVVYQVGRQPVVEHSSDALPVTAQDMWRWDASAADFSALTGGAKSATVSETTEAYVVQCSTERQGDGVVQAALTISKRTMQAVRQSVIVEQAGAAREYRFDEDGLESVPAARVDMARFEPDAELTAAAAAPPALVATPPADRVPDVGAPRFSDVDLDRLEMRVTYRLQALDPCVLAPSLDRTTGGLLVGVSAVGSACLARARSALEPLAHTPGMTLAFRPAASASRAPAFALPRETARMPVYPVLQRFLARRETADADQPGDEAVRDLATWALERVSRAAEHARAMKQLADRWPPETLERLDLDTVAMWQDMLRDRARLFGRESADLRGILQPALFPGLSIPAGEAELTIRNVADVAPAVERVLTLALAQQEAWQALTRTSGKAVAVDGTELGRLLLRSERAATAFAEPWSLGRD